jgi:hypothetical protein
MVSNQIKMACFARHLFIVPLLLLTSLYYTSSLQGNGMLYFILPQSGFDNNKINSKFIYDITCLTTNDTVALNFSYFDKHERTIDSIVFISDNKRFSSTVKKIFIETEKNKWHYRYSTNFLFADLKTFYSQDNCPKIILITQNGSVALTIKTSIWKKQSLVTKKILTLITYNQKK